MRTIAALWLAVGFLPCAALAEPAPWTLPAEAECGALRVPGGGGEALPDYKPGQVLVRKQLDSLRPLLPPEMWEQRELLFFEGMRLELGPCFRHYTPPDFFAESTRKFAGQSRLLENGGLASAGAGLPFDPVALTPEDPEVGQKWAWNVAHRYQAAGQFGDLRLVYVDHGKTTVHIIGDFFLAQLSGRADLPGSDHRLPWARSERWVAGGKTRDPSTGHHCAFRQLRFTEADANPEAADSVFFLSSEMRRPERIGWDPEFPLVACAYQRGFYLLRGGRVGRYRWRLVGVRDVVAPINIVRPSYPEDPDRVFGPSGASLASDRWELRRTLVLEAGDESHRIRQYVDVETLFPLLLVDGPVLVQSAGRWSEDRPGYPTWANSTPRSARILDPVVAVTVSPSEVVRVEAWNSVGLAPDETNLRNLVSTEALTRER
ncbi:MAG TPA: DUF1329 domain-containing protein [Myxococcota bacterium]|nr:DUF1329 domain-containing protein [Myxococcota bacterium]